MTNDRFRRATRRAALTLSLIAACDGSSSVAPNNDSPPQPPPPAASGGFTIATYLNGASTSELDHGRDVAVDAAGNIYVTGGTGDAAFPTTPGAYQRTFGRGGTPTAIGSFGTLDVFVMKFAPNGTLLWSTLLGGPNYDRAYAIEVDASGVYIGGRAGAGFPTTPGTVQPQFAGDTPASSTYSAYGPQDGFIAKLSLDGGSLLWATYFGGPGAEFLRDLAIDAAGNVYPAVSGAVPGFSHVTPQSFQPIHGGGQDGVACRINPNGTGVQWCTFLGGSRNDGAGASIRVDAAGAVYFAQMTASLDAPVTPGAARSQYGGGGTDMLVSKIAPDGRTLLYSTYFGGNGNDDGETHTLSVTTSGEVVVGAWTTSTNLPVTTGALQTTPGGTGDGFVARLSADGRQIVACTYLGGSGNDFVEGVALDGFGNIVASGSTRSSNFPVSADAAQSTNHGNADAFVVSLSADLRTLIRGSLAGGTGADNARAVTVDAVRGMIFVVGATVSSNFPTSAQAFSKQYAGGDDAFLIAWPLR